MENIIIEKVQAADIGQLQRIGKQTFVETFADANTAENMQKYLAEGFAVDKLIAEINNPETEFYFARFSGEVIGYLKINYGSAQTELKDESALEIERIYVLKAYHGKKVGQLLYDKAFDLAAKSKASYLWLGVWEKNTRAINFYTRNGFVEFDQHIFKLGDDEQTDIMMKLEFAPTQ